MMSEMVIRASVAVNHVNIQPCLHTHGLPSMIGLTGLQHALNRHLTQFFGFKLGDFIDHGVALSIKSLVADQGMEKRVPALYSRPKSFPVDSLKEEPKATLQGNVLFRFKSERIHEVEYQYDDESTPSELASLMAGQCRLGGGQIWIKKRRVDLFTDYETDTIPNWWSSNDNGYFLIDRTEALHNVNNRVTRFQELLVNKTHIRYFFEMPGQYLESELASLYSDISENDEKCDILKSVHSSQDNHYDEPSLKTLIEEKISLNKNLAEKKDKHVLALIATIKLLGKQWKEKSQLDNQSRRCYPVLVGYRYLNEPVMCQARIESPFAFAEPVLGLASLQSKASILKQAKNNPRIYQQTFWHLYENANQLYTSKEN